MKLEKTASGVKKVTIARKEWEEIGVKSGWMKTAQAVQPQQGQAPQANPQKANEGQRITQICEQALRQVEQQSNQLPMNGKQIRALLGQVRQLILSDPTVAQ